MNETSYLVGLNGPIEAASERLRIRFQQEGNAILAFTAQYETTINHEWLPVVRYDTAHGFPHKDTLDRSGREIAKEPMTAQSLNDALNNALADLRANWRTYRASF